MFTHVGDARNAASSGTSASVTHGLTINAGDLVVAYVNSNSTDSVSPDADAGGTWTTRINETPSGETCRQGLFSKIANASEPSSYSVTVGNANWELIVKVFRPSAGTPTVDAAATSAITPNNVHPIPINAIDGAVISDGAVSIVFGGKDNRSGTNTSFSTADNSYVGVIGNTEFQEAAGAHRIYTTGQTFSGQVTIDAASNSQTDKCYSVHISFVESAAGFDLAGTETSASELSGAMDAQPALSGRMTSGSRASASMDAQPSLGGVIVSASEASAALSLLVNLSALMASDSRVRGTLGLDIALTGAMVSTSELSGALETVAQMLLAGTARSRSQLAADLHQTIGLGGQSVSASESQALLGLLQSLRGRQRSLSAAMGALALELALRGDMRSLSALTAALQESFTPGLVTIDGIRLVAALEGHVELQAAVSAQIELTPPVDGSITLTPRT